VDHLAAPAAAAAGLPEPADHRQLSVGIKNSKINSITGSNKIFIASCSDSE
jgi:hypothetical protein